MKNIVYTLILLVLLIGCNCNNSNNENIETNYGLKEKFVFKGFNIGVEIYLFPDFTFLNRFYSRACLGGFFIKNVTGTYSLNGDSVVFSPQTMVFKEDWEAFEVSETTKIDTVEYYKSDSTKIQTEYRVVEVDDVKFLVSESGVEEYDDILRRNSNFIALANLYNSYERVNTTQKLLANKDTVINFRNLNVAISIPTKWQDYFLEEPIEAEIASARVVKYPKIYGYYYLIPTYELNIGSQAGLKEGMILYSEKKKEIDINVVQVEANKSIAEGEDIFYFDTRFKTGTILSTRKN